MVSHPPLRAWIPSCSISTRLVSRAVVFLSTWCI